MADSLYDKYGGFAGIHGVVSKLYDKVADSKTLEPWFKHIDMTNLIDHQTKFLCKTLGGPDNFTGRALEAAHSASKNPNIHQKITQEAFNEVAGHLKAALEESGVEADDVDTIIGVVAGLVDKVVDVD